MVHSATAGDNRTAIEALFDNFVDIARDSTSTLLVPWLAIALVDFGFVALGVLSIVAFGTADPGTAGGIAVQVIAFVQGLAILTLRVALLKSLRDLALGGPSAISDYRAVADDIVDRLLPSLGIVLVVGAIVAVGMILCVLPGLIALFFLAFAPYLVAARRETLFNALRVSAAWAARQWAVLLSAIVVAVLATGLMACVMGALSGLFARVDIAVPAGMMGGWLVNTAVGYLAFLWWGAVYVTAESRQHMETFRETAPDQRGPGRAGEPTGPEVRERSGAGAGERTGDTSIYRTGEGGDQGSSSPDGEW